MKIFISTLSLLFVTFLGLSAQESKDIQSVDKLPATVSADSLPSDSLIKKRRAISDFEGQMPNFYHWKITPRLGERILVPRDTLLYGFHQTSLVDGKDVAVGYQGNIGTAAQTKIFFDRGETSRFNFLDGYAYWRKNPEDHLFINTKIPFSNVYYQSGGGGESKEEDLKVLISSNIGKKLNVGFDFNYLYARGHYTNLYNKQVNYDLFASYIGDKYKMHAFFNNNNFNNAENGGITQPRFITNANADDVKALYNGDSKNIPVRFEHDTWNRMRGRNIYITNKYDLGNDEEVYVVNDTIVNTRKKKDYVSPASIIFTTHYSDQRRRFLSNFSEMDNLYKNYYTDIAGNVANEPNYKSNINDYTAYWSLKNTLALAMNEGFRDWTKFGLTAFVEYDIRKYSLPKGPFVGLHERKNENSLIIGGVLSKEKGEFLRYKVSGEKNLIDSDFRLQGEIATRFKFKEKDYAVKAEAYFKTIAPTYLENNFASKYWNWSTKFDNIRRVYVGGEIILPSFSFSKTSISGGVENLTNYIYYNEKGLPAQNGDNVQVVALRLKQQLSAGILHWDNDIVYQTSTNQETLPLPKLSLYTNLYITSKIAKVLTFQLGVDAHFHTKYYIPGYEPLTMQFYNQRDTELGNFPIATAYLNLHLKYTKFFIMMYNVADGMGNSESFALYRYPVNPRGLKLGLSWNFNN